MSVPHITQETVRTLLVTYYAGSGSSFNLHELERKLLDNDELLRRATELVRILIQLYIITTDRSMVTPEFEVEVAFNPKVVDHEFRALLPSNYDQRNQTVGGYVTLMVNAYVSTWNRMARRDFSVPTSK